MPTLQALQEEYEERLWTLGERLDIDISRIMRITRRGVDDPEGPTTRVILTRRLPEELPPSEDEHNCEYEDVMAAIVSRASSPEDVFGGWLAPAKFRAAYRPPIFPDWLYRDGAWVCS